MAAKGEDDTPSSCCCQPTPTKEQNPMDTLRPQPTSSSSGAPPYRIEQDGSIVLNQPQGGPNLRCRFPGPAGAAAENVPCSTNAQGEVCCKPEHLTGAELQGEEEVDDEHAQLLMEVLENEKCVAKHRMPPGYSSRPNSMANSLDPEALNIISDKAVKANYQQGGTSGMPTGMPVIDNPLAMRRDDHDELKAGELALKIEDVREGDGDGGDGGGDKGGKGDKSKKEGYKATYGALKPFIIMSSSYLLFTITDGAIRTIILFHAHNLGFTAMEVAIMFMAYELAGVVTNLLAGVMGAKWGIKTTLLTGLSLQIIGSCILMAWQDSWGNKGEKWKAIVFATMTQITVGVAKDLVKLGGKTVTKLVTPDEKQSMLFKLVTFITGWKNSLKGVGYFVGSAAVSFNYYFSLGLMIFLILLAYPWAVTGLSNQLGRTRKENLTLKGIFNQNYNINVLSISRFFLFASRDLWFEVPLPFFVRNAAYGLGWTDYQAGLTMGVFIIVYGQFQSWTPQLLLTPLRQMPANKWVNVFWCSMLVCAPVYLGTVLQASGYHAARETGPMVSTFLTGLFVFALLFAINSATHSYLIVRYAEGDKVAMNVGFYYMANAAGRLVGTIVSGALYTYADENKAFALAACFWASLAFVIISAIVDAFARDDIGGLKLGCCTIVPPPPGQDERLQNSKTEVAGE